MTPLIFSTTGDKQSKSIFNSECKHPYSPNITSRYCKH
ncbi:unnamed protein product [Schistosoma margrebowiei]|uniref:Uncharacterized protein n=1 Tax=Schistosoma margrebowiei TaxID=48269 RepID=A0A183LXQ7_9TREM|nr:unnamed protein product [Schistosoma margrebowiei]